MDTWTQWYNFYDIYEYHDLVNKNFILIPLPWKSLAWTFKSKI